MVWIKTKNCVNMEMDRPTTNSLYTWKVDVQCKIRLSKHCPCSRGSHFKIPTEFARLWLKADLGIIYKGK